MERRPYGRDVGLSIRMGIALIPIVLWYLPVAALLLGLAVFVAPLKKRLERLGKLSRQLGKAG